MSGGSAWIEPKTGLPCRVKWRTLQTDGSWKRASSETFYSRGPAKAACDAKNRELNQVSDTRRRFSVSRLFTINQLLELRSGAKVRTNRNNPGYAREFTTNVQAMAEEMGWINTSDITVESVQRWLLKRANGVGIRKPMQNLKSLLRWAKRPPQHQPIHDEVLLIEVETIPERTTPELLTEDELAAVLEMGYAFGLSQGAMLEHQARFGPRPTTLVPLNVRDWRPRAKLGGIGAKLPAHVGGFLRITNTKNGEEVLSPMPTDFADKLNQLVAGRGPDMPLYVNPLGERWKPNKNDGAGQFTDWYWNNISSKILPHHKRGSNALKDFAISTMDANGVDDATKQKFTGHRDIHSYKRYKTTNQPVTMHALTMIPKPIRRVGAVRRVLGANLGAKSPGVGNSGGGILNTAEHGYVKTPKIHRKTRIRKLG